MSAWAYSKTDKKPTVPVIIHDGKVIQDSWTIIQYLEKAFPEKPRLLGDNIGLHRLFLDYCEQHVMIPLFLLCILDIYSRFPDQAIQNWFRERIEKQLGGITLENAAQDVTRHIAELKSALQPIDGVLQDNEYITGPQVGYADVVLASFLYTLQVFQKERLENEILDNMGGLAAWWKRMKPYTEKQ
ncbi:hypothetical protein BCR43DRAFT_517804 [Syncephalastrum racemosum]|uniref:Glutathione S-transferase n=1 Tax=Syncephalastrum racemosum TaxID=13706 RepID=A0A1X2H5D7_SYNRA|nr:hypothetical protein BCR43DRAFT_517804 [Syncephalastrum racemosum]